MPPLFFFDKLFPLFVLRRFFNFVDFDDFVPVATAALSLLISVVVVPLRLDTFFFIFFFFPPPTLKDFVLFFFPPPPRPFFPPRPFDFSPFFVEVAPSASTVILSWRSAAVSFATLIGGVGSEAPSGGGDGGVSSSGACFAEEGLAGDAARLAGAGAEGGGANGEIGPGDGVRTTGFGAGGAPNGSPFAAVLGEGVRLNGFGAGGAPNGSAFFDIAVVLAAASSAGGAPIGFAAEVVLTAASASTSCFFSAFGFGEGEPVSTPGGTGDLARSVLGGASPAGVGDNVPGGVFIPLVAALCLPGGGAVLAALGTADSDDNDAAAAAAFAATSEVGGGFSGFPGAAAAAAAAAASRSTTDERRRPGGDFGAPPVRGGGPRFPDVAFFPGGGAPLDCPDGGGPLFPRPDGGGPRLPGGALRAPPSPASPGGFAALLTPPTPEADGDGVRTPGGDAPPRLPTPGGGDAITCDVTACCLRTVQADVNLCSKINFFNHFILF